MTELVFAANNPELGGAEVMLLALAEAARSLAVGVTVVAQRGELIERADRAGHPTVVLAGHDRRSYLVNLRRFDARRRGVLWANGLVPALATAGHRRRIVSLHLAPAPAHRPALALAAAGTLATLVPSAALAARLPGTRVLANWTAPVPAPPRVLPGPGDPVMLGFLGRLHPAKGLGVLTDALLALDAADPGRFRLLVAGEPRFVGDAEAATVAAALDRLGDRVVRAGWLEPAAFFGAVDLLVVPSTGPEAFGLVVAEAMSAGCPFVISDAGALPEVAGPSHPWTAPAGDPAALARTIAAAVAGYRPEQVDAAQRRWREVHSPEAGRARLALLLADLGLV